MDIPELAVTIPLSTDRYTWPMGRAKYWKNEGKMATVNNPIDKI